MRKQVESVDAPKADHILSQALVVNETIYVSGQVHNTPDGTLIEGDTKTKVDQIMQNIKAILAAADSSLDNIVKVVIYVTDMSMMPEMNEVYPSYFTKPFPVREAVCVSALPLGASIEISVVAAK